MSTSVSLCLSALIGDIEDHVAELKHIFRTLTASVRLCISGFVDNVIFSHNVPCVTVTVTETFVLCRLLEDQWRVTYGEGISW